MKSVNAMGALAAAPPASKNGSAGKTIQGGASIKARTIFISESISLLPNTHLPYAFPVAEEVARLQSRSEGPARHRQKPFR